MLNYQESRLTEGTHSKLWATQPIYRVRYCEMNGTTTLQLVDFRSTYNWPTDNSAHDYRIEIDTTTGQVLAYFDGHHFNYAHWLDTLWITRRANMFSLQTEINYAENDMFGDIIDKCFLTNCSAFTGNGATAMTFSQSQQRTDDSSQWLWDTIYDTLLVWDVRPL